MIKVSVLKKQFYVFIRYHNVDPPTYLPDDMALSVLALIKSKGGSGVVLWGNNMEPDLADKPACLKLQVRSCEVKTHLYKGAMWKHTYIKVYKTHLYKGVFTLRLMKSCLTSKARLMFVHTLTTVPALLYMLLIRLPCAKVFENLLIASWRI